LLSLLQYCPGNGQVDVPHLHGKEFIVAPLLLLQSGVVVVVPQGHSLRWPLSTGSIEQAATLPAVVG
tara:strand:- start:285 stop:485 length:201 start_codon:yes stop_codon:yes gene_type:complete